MVVASASPLLLAAAGGGALLIRQLFDAPTGTLTDLLAAVRSAKEFEGPDGHIAGSRSALATQQLLKAGRDRVANLRGGLSRWGDEGYPLESASAS
jgi:3-mercaptopyruvate sulfurtransferase SseA